MTNAPSKPAPSPPVHREARDRSQKPAQCLSGSGRRGAFDYSSEAELFPTRNRKPGRQAFRYKRFAQAAYAIRFAIEELPPEALLGASLEVNEERYDSTRIRLLYESADYPLARRAANR